MQAPLTDYSWMAGVATALVNTAPGVHNGTDQLADPGRLAAFLDEHGLAGPAPEEGGEDAGVGDGDVTAVRRLRDRVRAVIDDPEPGPIVEGATALTGSARGITLAGAGTEQSEWRVIARSGASVADRLALACGLGVLGVLHTLGPDRFRACQSPTCSGAFIDTSRSGRRRYCVPEICGNRVNVANHRARTQSARAE